MQEMGVVDRSRSDLALIKEDRRLASSSPGLSESAFSRADAETRHVHSARIFPTEYGGTGRVTMKVQICVLRSLLE